MSSISRNKGREHEQSMKGNDESEHNHSFSFLFHQVYLTHTATKLGTRQEQHV